MAGRFRAWLATYLRCSSFDLAAAAQKARVERTASWALGEPDGWPKEC